jgi:hypothetical protein
MVADAVCLYSHLARPPFFVTLFVLSGESRYNQVVRRLSPKKSQASGDSLLESVGEFPGSREWW